MHDIESRTGSNRSAALSLVVDSVSEYVYGWMGEKRCRDASSMARGVFSVTALLVSLAYSCHPPKSLDKIPHKTPRRRLLSFTITFGHALHHHCSQDILLKNSHTASVTLF